MEANTQPSRLRLLDVNPHLVCYLCGGYYIDATTIIECLHSFCKSCIIRYLENKSICPICDVQIHKAVPYRNLRPDKALQTIVYKLVPDLYKKEMQRRREFYSKHPEYALHAKAEDRGIELERMIFSPNENISLALQYLEPKRSREEWESVSESSAGSGPGSPVGLQGAAESAQPSHRTRYLQCPAQVTVSVLKKFLRLKFELTPAHQVDMLHKNEVLTDDLRLMDIAYIYTWKRNSPMELQYRLLEEGWRERMDPCPSRLSQKCKIHSDTMEAEPVTASPPASATADDTTPIPEVAVSKTNKETHSSTILGAPTPSLTNESARKVPVAFTKVQKNLQLPGKGRLFERSGSSAEEGVTSRVGVIPRATTSHTVTSLLNERNASLEAGNISVRRGVEAFSPLAMLQASASMKDVAPADTTGKPCTSNAVVSRPDSKLWFPLTSATPSAPPLPAVKEPAVERPRISMGVLASLALERRTSAPIPATVVRKRPASLTEPADTTKLSRTVQGSPSPLVSQACSSAPPAKRAVCSSGRRQSATVPPRPTFFAHPDHISHMPSIPRLIQIGRAAGVSESKRSPEGQRCGHGRYPLTSPPRMRDGFGALDLSRSRLLSPPNISTVAENLALRQLMQQQQLRVPQNARPPAPPLSPLSALAPFAPSYGPVRSPPGARASADAAARAMAQRPSSLSSSSPSPPATGDSGSQPFRSRFEVSASPASFDDWCNEHLLRCYDSFLRAESLSAPREGSFFQYAAAAAAAAANARDGALPGRKHTRPSQ